MLRASRTAQARARSGIGRGTLGRSRAWEKCTSDACRALSPSRGYVAHGAPIIPSVAYPIVAVSLVAGLVVLALLGLGAYWLFKPRPAPARTPEPAPNRRQSPPPEAPAPVVMEDPTIRERRPTAEDEREVTDPHGIAGPEDEE